MKKGFLSLLLAAAMLLTLAGGAMAEGAHVDFWYLWAGVEGECVESIIAAYNESQEDVTVEGLSTPDMQAIIAAISSGAGPDISDDFSNNVASYASMGVLMPLDDLIAESGISLDDFAPATLEACRYEGKLYALPISMQVMCLFYNKDLFDAAGLTPPKTDVELLEAAKALTTLNEDGSIDVLGFPDFPNVYYLDNMMHALGGSNFDGDMNLTPDNEGTRRALEMIVDYRETFGVDNVLRFSAGGKYMDPTDPFIAGKQALRIDGPWLGGTLAELGQDINYGIIPLPYLAGQEDQAGTALVTSSIAYIPANAKDPKAAFDFLIYWTMGEGAKTFMTGMNNFPALYSLMETPEFAELTDFPEIGVIAASPNLKVAPVYGQMTEYNKIIADEAELAMALVKSVDEALAAMAEQAKDLE